MQISTEVNCAILAYNYWTILANIFGKYWNVSCRESYEGEGTTKEGINKKNGRTENKYLKTFLIQVGMVIEDD